MNTTTQDEKTLIAQSYFEAWCAHDDKNIGELFSAEAMYSDPVRFGIAKQVVPTFLRHGLEIFPDMLFNIVTLISSKKDTVAVEWNMKGTNTTAFGIYSATNKAISVNGVDIITIDKGKITALRSYFDEKTYSKQMGLIA